MIRAIALIACLIPGLAAAQSETQPPADMDAMHHMMHGQHMMSPGQHMMQGQHMTPAKSAAGPVVTEPGQSAFAAIQEIVELLEADPATDWSKVNIDALRQHLIDMDNVTLRAEVRSEAIEGGMRFTISGVGPVKNSIQRMVTAHAATMNGASGWTFTASETDAGAILNVLTPAKDIVKLRALGFLGIMTRGMHHQMHHLMIARGENPHE
jgi:hypothetical protein